MTTKATKTDARGRVQPLFKLVCKECNTTFSGNARAVFCTPGHKRAFHQRNQKRGQCAMPLLLAWRGGRGQKETSRWAYGELCRLADLWNAEDKAAGRAPQAAYAELKRRDFWTAADYYDRGERRA
jgi:hypothetical protein